MTTVALDLPQYALFFGGPLQLVEKNPGSGPSLTILVRGAAGVGKTILATDLATLIAKKLESDVAYACLELLPAELKAQHEALYDAHGYVVVTPLDEIPRDAPYILAGAIDLGDRAIPDDVRGRFEESLVGFIDGASKLTDRAMKVVVVDSVSPDYGIGGRAVPRHVPDAVAKYAAGEGLVIIVIEEAYDDDPTPWSFACDLVVEIGDRGTGRGSRSVRLSKNRFGQATRDPGEFRISPGTGPTIAPPLSSYRHVPRELVPGGPDDSDWSDPVRSLARLPSRRSSPLVFIEYQAGHRDSGRRIVSSIAKGTSSRSVVFVDFGVVTRAHWFDSPEDRLLESSTPKGTMRTIRTTIGPLDTVAIQIMEAVRGMVSSRRSAESPGVSAIVVDIPVDNEVVTNEMLKAIDPLARLARALEVPLLCSCHGVDASKFSFVATLRYWADAALWIGAPEQRNPMMFALSTRVGDTHAQGAISDPLGVALL